MKLVVVRDGKQHITCVRGVGRELQMVVYIAICGWCSCEYLADAPHQVYCSDKCRKTAHRKHKRSSPLFIGDPGAAI